MKVMLTTALMMFAAGASALASVDAVVETLKTGSPEQRLEARRQAAALGAEAVAPLAGLVDSGDYEASKSARAALANLAHHAARPGAPGEQQAVAAELAELLEGDPAPAVAGIALELLGYIGGREQVPAVSACLAKPELAQPALRALQRIPGRTGTEALAVALPAAEPDLAAQIAYALGERDDPAAVPALAAAARGEDQKVALAAVRALARLGAVEAETVAKTLMSAPKHAIGLAALDAAHALMKEGEDAAAQRILLTAARSQGGAPIILGALAGLDQTEYPRFSEVALSFAGDPDIRPTVVKLLRESDEDRLDAKLAKAAHNADAPFWIRSAATEVLVAREAPQAPGAIDALARSEEAALRMLAAQLKGEAPPLKDVAHVAAHGPAWRQSEALAVFMRNVSALANSGDTQQVRGLLTEFLGAPAPAWAKADALDLLAPIATMEDVPRIEALEADDELAGRAEAAALRVATAHADQDEALALLREAVAESVHSEATSFALSQLQELGEDVRPALRSRGYLVDWAVLGPFPNEGNAAFGKDFIDPAQATGEGTVAADGATYEWQEAAASGLPAVVNLKQWLYPNTNTAAYAYAEVELDQTRQAVLELGSDDGCEVWVNGARVHAAPEPRSMTPADDEISLSLPAGESEFLLKVLQGGGDWQFSARLVTPGGKPIDLR